MSLDKASQVTSRQDAGSSRGPERIEPFNLNSRLERIHPDCRGRRFVVAAFFEVAGSSTTTAATMVSAVGKFFPTLSNPVPPFLNRRRAWLGSWRCLLDGRPGSPAMDEVGMQATADSRPILPQAVFGELQRLSATAESRKLHNPRSCSPTRNRTGAV